MRTIQQLRAEDALMRVESLENENAQFKTLYRSYADSLGPTIVMNGLGQALATEVAAAGKRGSTGEKAHDRLYRNISQWLCRDGGVYSRDSDVLKAIVSNDESHFVRAQAEALAWLEWHKKFCRAYLPADEGGRSD